MALQETGRARAPWVYFGYSADSSRPATDSIGSPPTLTEMCLLFMESSSTTQSVERVSGLCRHWICGAHSGTGILNPFPNSCEHTCVPGFLHISLDTRVKRSSLSTFNDGWFPGFSVVLQRHLSREKICFQ